MNGTDGRFQAAGQRPQNFLWDESLREGKSRKTSVDHYRDRNNQLKLPAGTHSVFIIAWGKREVLTHNRNLTEYFAKMTLTVK